MSIASRGGLLLYIRAVKTTFNTARIFKYSVSSVSGEYVVRRFWDNKFNFEQEGQGFDLYRQFVQDFRKNGNNNPDSLDKALKNEAFKFIKLHPIKYLLYGFIEINNLNSPIIYYDRHFSMFHNNVYNKTIIKLTIVILLRFFWLLFLFLVLFGIYRIFREKKRMAYVFIILILYINLILFFLQGYPRSLVSVLPLYIMLAVYSFNHLMGRYILRRHNYK
jgi:hypothetical protein